MNKKHIMKKALAGIIAAVMVLQTGIFAGEVFSPQSNSEYYYDEIDLSDFIDLADTYPVGKGMEENAEDFDLSDWIDISEDEISKTVVSAGDGEMLGFDEVFGDISFEESSFIQGYVLVKEGQIAYETSEGKDEAGTFDEASFAYAELFERGEFLDVDWLKLIFDTDEARMNGTDFMTVYIPLQDIEVLSGDDEAGLIFDLEMDESTRKYKEVLIPSAHFVSKVNNVAEVAFSISEEENAFSDEIVFEENGIEENAANEVSSTDQVNNNSSEEETLSIEEETLSSEEDELTFDLSVSSEVSASNSLIIAQPEDLSGVIGEKVYFSITAEGDGLTYQWQMSGSNGLRWNNTTLTGYKTSTLTVPVTAARNNYLYRCIVTDANGVTEESEGGRLTVVSLRIASQPQDVEGVIGQKAYYHVDAKGTGLTYQWQMSGSNGKRWNNTTLTGYKTNTLTVPITAARDGYIYRCVVTDENGETVTSESAKLTVIALKIIAQPVDCEGVIGEKAYFSVEAAGSSLTYQWQMSGSNGKRWNNTTLTGYKTATLTVPITAARDGYLYRCVVTDSNGNTVTSEPALLTIIPLVIVKQPSDFMGMLGEKATFEIEAKGSNVTYQWQLSTNGGESWANTALIGNKTAKITPNILASRDGYLYRCVVSDDNGNTLESEPGALLVDPFRIVSQPEDVEDVIGNKAVFEVSVGGNGLSYQWQASTNNGKKWINSSFTGNKTEKISFNITAARDGFLYRCVITDENGRTLTSEAAKLTVLDEFAIGDFIFKLTDDATSVIVKAYLGSDANVTVPDTAKNFPVTEIGEGAFEGNTALVSITLPETITVIGKRAFKNCTNLCSMN